MTTLSWPRSIAALLLSATVGSAAQMSRAQVRGAADPSGPIVIDRHVSADVLGQRQAMREAVPPLPGFRAGWGGSPHLPFDVPESAAGSTRDAAAVIAQRLARDGMLTTLAHALHALQPHERADEGSARAALMEAGLPVDVLDFFQPNDSADSRTPLEWARQQAASGAASDDIARDLRAAFRCAFHQSAPGFRAASESGEHDIELLRLQLTRGGYWQGPGDGGNLDITRQLIQALPGTPLVLSIERRHLADFLQLLKSWRMEHSARVRVVVEDLLVAQWAQDNCKPGFIAPSSAGERASIALLAPRFASRGEAASTFVPGETFLLEGVTAAGVPAIQSPLLFQGGNLLIVTHPATGERLMLIGEAELYRNMALGLSREQALETFRIEFGVDRCEVLPAVSFHIDCDVTVRAHGGELLAFVNDTQPAVRIILEQGLDALRRHGRITSEAAAAAAEHLAAGRGREFIALVAPAVFGHATPQGGFPLWLAEDFSSGGVDSGVGNFQVFLLAFDTLASAALLPQELPTDRLVRSYLESLRRLEDDRRALHDRLAKLGFRVVPIPGLADAERSIIPINGIHARGKYLMPAYGGLYSRLDDAAAAAFGAALGPDVRIVPILCAESQRRVGALHCSASVCYRP